MQNNNLNDQYITLSDIINIVIKRKFFIIIFILSGLIIGVIWANFLPKKQEYRAIISIGHYGYNTKNGTLVFNPIFSPEAIVARINSIYMPLIKADYFEHYQKNFATIQVASLSDGSSIVLKAIIKPRDKGIYENLFDEILKKIVNDEEVKKNYYTLFLHNQLTSLKEQLNLINDQSKILGDYSEDYNIQSNKQLLAQFMHASLNNNSKTARQNLQESSSIINFLGEFDIEEMNYYMRLLKNNLINYEIYAVNIKAKIQSLEQELGQIKESSFLVMPSFNAASNSTNIILSIFLITFLATILGIFLALCKEFLKR